MTHSPYSETDEQTTEYRFVGSYLRLPGDRVTLEEGDVVELPDRVAGPIDDLLEPVDGSTPEQPAADAGEDGGDDADSDEPAETADESDADQEDDTPADGGLRDVEAVETPDEFPETVPDADAWEWSALREVSSAHDVNASQSKEEQVADLRAIGE